MVPRFYTPLRRMDIHQYLTIIGLTGWGEAYVGHGVLPTPCTRLAERTGGVGNKKTSTKVTLQ
jgi:hypothetical protein